MKLYLIQHAEEAERELDAERHLSAPGIRDIEAIGQFLQRNQHSVPLIVHSGRHRARETAERLARHIGPEAAIEESEGLRGRDPADSWIERLSRIEGDLAIIGHMPNLAKLASLLLTGTEDADMIGFERGAVACLEKRPEGDRWRLCWMIPPALIVR